MAKRQRPPTNAYIERGHLVTVITRWKGSGPRNVAVRRADGHMVVRPFRGLRRIAGPIEVPHPLDECYGSRLHCWNHGADEPDSPCYRACLECRHVFGSAAELLAAHNEHLDVALAEQPETDAGKVSCCPLCTHSW